MKNIRKFVRGFSFAMTALVCVPLARARAQAPSADALKQAVNQSLQKLLKVGYTERQVLFQDVRAGTPSGTEYPFQVTLLIRDYEPGNPSSRYYGNTCVGRMDKNVFVMKRDPFGAWQVTGTMSVLSGPDLVCKPNPSAGVSSIPLASLQGTQASAGNPPAAPAAAPQGKGSPVASGEWACYANGVLIGSGFRIEGNGQYSDPDLTNRGTYTVQPGAATITFKGGQLDGQTGRSFRGNEFEMSNRIHCEKSP